MVCSSANRRILAAALLLLCAVVAGPVPSARLGTATAGGPAAVVVTLTLPDTAGTCPKPAFWFLLAAEECFAIVYRHSVERTFVEEWIGIDPQLGLVVREMRYQSFGAGLPFAPAEGSWRQQDDYFVWQDIDMALGQFSLLLSPENQYELHLSGGKYSLQALPAGTKLNFAVQQRIKEAADIGQFFEDRYDAEY